MTEGGKRIIADKHFPITMLGIHLDRNEVAVRYKETALRAFEAGVVLGKDAFALNIARSNHDDYEVCGLDLGRGSFLGEHFYEGHDARLAALDNAGSAVRQVFGESIEDPSEVNDPWW